MIVNDDNLADNDSTLRLPTYRDQDDSDEEEASYYASDGLMASALEKMGRDPRDNMIGLGSHGIGRRKRIGNKSEGGTIGLISKS